MGINLKKIKKAYRTNKQGVLFLASGIFLLLIFSAWRFHQARILSFWSRDISANQSLKERKGEIPVYIKSYPLGIDIKIKEASIKNGVWQIFPDAAGHLDTSARIGEGGNIVIYGHNKDEILGPVRYIKEGAKIELFDSDGNKYVYTVVKTDTVEPNDISYILPKDEEILTIYTCIGFFDSKRFIAVAKRDND